MWHSHLITAINIKENSGGHIFSNKKVQYEIVTPLNTFQLTRNETANAVHPTEAIKHKNVLQWI